ncbi:hypothetical protein [Rhizobium leguminosarum]|uniref:hypothetical protein n=1 Tax=Rhizobium leguminosarum TaxID=384 RepID=UPI002E0DA5EF|nr:hypothetical protein U8Q02_40200 [Rhizobium leguminosarum]
MASGKELKELEALAEAGLWDEFVHKVGPILERQGGDPDGRVYEILDRAAESSTEAALVAGMSYFKFARPNMEVDARRHLLKASRSENPSYARMANFALATHLASDEKHWPEVAARMEEAAFLGDVDAMAAFGAIRISGRMGVRADVEDGEEWLVMSSDGGSVRGSYELAMHMINSKRLLDEKNPIELLLASAQAGHEPSRKALFEMGLLDEDAHDPMLPYPVTPDGAGRTTGLVEAFVEHFDIEPETAMELVAALHGYPDWELLLASAGDPAKRKGKFDEDCGAEEMVERERLQASVVQHFLHMPSFVAEAVVETVRPTSSAPDVVVKDFERAVERRSRNMTVDDVGQSMMAMMRSVMSGIGLGRKSV